MSVGYADRAALYAVETRHLRAPLLLSEYLTPGITLAEAPSGTGHHLDRYLEAGAEVHFVDAEPAMLSAARRRSPNIHTVEFRIGIAPPPRTFPLVICPNAAVNYLAATVGFPTAVEGLASLVAPGGHLLLHVLPRHADGQIDRAACYDPAAPHDTWLPEWSRPDGAGGILSRRRRQQHRAADEIEVDFERRHNRTALGRSTVRLSLLTFASIDTVPNLNTVAFHREPHALSEIVLRKESRP